jgi:hypothetical protein
MAIRVQSLPRIAWDMFKVVDSIPDTPEAAQIHPEFAGVPRFSPERTPGGRFRLPPLVLNVGLDRSDTMVLRSANKTPELLKHEQGHYDLLVLVIRALARDLESLEAASVSELGRLMNDTQQTHTDRAQALDDAYDTQTNHSRDRQAQARWDGAIAAALANPRADTVSNLPL